MTLASYFFPYFLVGVCVSTLALVSCFATFGSERFALNDLLETPWRLHNKRPG